MTICIWKGCNREATEVVAIRLPERSGYDVIVDEARNQDAPACREHAAIIRSTGLARGGDSQT